MLITQRRFFFVQFTKTKEKRLLLLCIIFKLKPVYRSIDANHLSNLTDVCVSYIVIDFDTDFVFLFLFHSLILYPICKTISSFIYGLISV